MTAPVDGIAGWTSFTPAIVGSSSSPTLNASSLGRYFQAGKTVKGFVACVLATAGSGYYSITLPVPPVTDATQLMGTGFIIDASASSLARLVTFLISPAFSTTGGVCFYDDAAVETGDNPVGATKPWEFAAGDTIAVGFEYEAD